MDNKNCIASVPDCIKELSQLKSQIYTLELKLKNLGLEDLEDVTYCLNPKIGDSLVYNGNKWVAKKVSGSGGGSTVEVESLLSTGNPIAKITVDGEEHTILESNTGGGTGNLDNVKVNNITGTVNNKIAEVTVTGNDINLSTFEEPDKTNEELEIESSDKVTEALAKLQKALKDDEAAVTQAFMSIENATGFNDNLEYVPEESTTILANAKNLQDADAILMNNLTQLNSDFNIVKNNQIRFSGGASKLVKFDEIPQGGSYNISIPYEGNCTNITYRFPITEYAQGESYWSKTLVLTNLKSHLLPPLIHKGRVITFEVSDKVWEWWQYVGPMNGDTLPQNWEDSANWKQLNISYV